LVGCSKVVSGLAAHTRAAITALVAVSNRELAKQTCVIGSQVVEGVAGDTLGGVGLQAHFTAGLGAGQTQGGTQVKSTVALEALCTVAVYAVRVGDITSLAAAIPQQIVAPLAFTTGRLGGAL